MKDDPDLKRFDGVNVSSTVTIPYTSAILGTVRSSITLVPIRPRSRGERRSLRTFPGVSLRPPLGFNLRPYDAFQLQLTPLNSTPTSSLRTESAQALCWFILWGSVSGHCLNAFWKGRLIFDPQPHSNPIFEVLFAAYYTPLYALVVITTQILKVRLLPIRPRSRGERRSLRRSFCPPITCPRD